MYTMSKKNVIIRPVHVYATCIGLYSLLCAIASSAQVHLPRLAGDSMILQRDTRSRIWGTASAGEKVTVRFNGQSPSVITGADGKWAVALAPMSAGGPFDMDIDASNHIHVKAILIGDVWVCSGQSNMELPMERVKEKYPAEIAAAGNPAIRQFVTGTHYDLTRPQEDFPAGSWQTATPASVLSFSAAGYFFAKALYQRYHVPIGLIKAAVGGAPAEAWLSEEALRSYPEQYAAALKYKDIAYPQGIRRKEDSVSRAWYQHLADQDSGLHDLHPWSDPAYDDAGWKEMTVPGYWADQGGPVVNGVVWLRKDIDVPAQLTGRTVKLMLGRIIDLDSVYVNGVLVGTTGYQYPPRRYQLPAGILRPGKNSFVIRVINSGGKGGLVPDKPYWLGLDDTRISLEGKWRYRLGASAEALPPTTFFQYQPMGLFNGELAPLLPYTIKGVIWYQGESNAGRAWEYRRLFTDLIGDWRNKWEKPDLPFLFVQLPNYGEAKPQPWGSSWAALREAQLQCLSIPHTGMAVAIDLGEWNDLHPLNKKDVGERLALAARAIAYGEKDLVWSGPLYRSFQVERNALRIHFNHNGSGLMARGGKPLKGFALAGADKKFIRAEATIEGPDVVVRSPAITHPVAVRYAWADNPEGANLYNKEGLPASPFRTDTAAPVDPPLHLTAGQDHHRMMQLLKIDSLRPGPSGNPNAPNAANTDEEKASPYTCLPDPLLLKNGKKVTTHEQWWQLRRSEIVEDFDREVYGRVPEHMPQVQWELVSAIKEKRGGMPVITKNLAGHVDNSSYPAITVTIDLTLTTPANAAGPVPVIMEFGPGRAPSPWQEQVLANGWGYAIIYPASIQADNGAGLTEGIIGLMNKGRPRKPDDWGALKAWAWGASRALDYFGTDPVVDAKQVGIEGLSRYGKAAIVAMAYEPRLAIAFVGSSGEGGVKIHRRHFGEQVENVASSGEYHWMAGNFLKYAGPLTPNDLPVDAHELVALCAPRPVFISSGSPQVEGNWVDAKGMFLGGIGAAPVYRLLGKKGLGATAFPPMETGLTDGEIAFRQHSGGHTTGPNWPAFLTWASRYIRIRQP
jgi:sialate O-acetylesterase